MSLPLKIKFYAANYLLTVSLEMEKNLMIINKLWIKVSDKIEDWHKSITEK